VSDAVRISPAAHDTPGSVAYRRVDHAGWSGRGSWPCGRSISGLLMRCVS